VPDASGAAARIERLDVAAYTIPIDRPEADGTIAWASTTLVLVELTAGGRRGLGYSYADRSAAQLIHDHFIPIVRGADPTAIPELHEQMVRSVRNIGRPGVASMAIAAVDIALWDLKARLLDVSLISLLGAARDGVPVYGSGGFTSYSIKELQDQLGAWAQQGIKRVKMKIGTQPEQDYARVEAARAAIGQDIELFVDANGAYSRKQALTFSQAFAELDVRWFEEPVSSDDLEGLRLLRDRAPPVMDIAAGEYGFDAQYFARMLSAGAVDVLQADATRCGGITGFLRAGALCEAAGLPLSAHTAPSVHVAPACAVTRLRHIEYFHDHVRIEHMLFDGAPTPIDGRLYPDRARPGLGLDFKHADAQRYRA